MECKKYVACLEKCHFNLKMYLKKIAFEDSGVKDIPFLTKILLVMISFRKCIDMELNTRQ